MPRSGPHRAYADLFFKKVNDAKNPIPIQTSIESKIQAGVDIYLKMVQMLQNNFETEFYAYQYKFLKKCMDALLPKIFGVKTFDECRSLIKRKLGLCDESMKQFLAFFAQRRSGKSLTLAHICVTAALCLDGDSYNPFRIAVFAHRTSSAKDFIAECAKVIKSAKGGILKEYDIDIQTTQIKIRHKVTGQEKIIRAYSGFNADGSRGFGADIILVDESSFITINTFLNSILPVACVNGTALICISSPKDSTGDFAKMINFKDSKFGYLFVRESFSGVCEECRSKKFNGAICPHISSDDVTVPHKSSEKKKMFAGLYTELGEYAANQRENEGIVVDDLTYCFQKEHVVDFVARPLDVTLENISRVNRLYLCIDPNGGGSNDAALSIGYYDGLLGNCVLLWADRSRCKTIYDFRDFVLGNLEAFYSKDCFNKYTSKPLFVATENNGPGYIGGSTQMTIIEFIITKFPTMKDKLFFISSDGIKAGWVKTKRNTCEYIRHTTKFLQDRKLKIHSNFYSLTSADKNEFKLGAEYVNTIKNTLQEQLCRFQAPDDFVGTDYNRYTKAKISGKVGSKNDDLAITVLMLCYFCSAEGLSTIYPFATIQ